MTNKTKLISFIFLWPSLCTLQETIAVTHVVDSTTFFAQICNAETATAYQTMINQLFEHCAYGPTPATEIQPNHVRTLMISLIKFS